MTDKWRWIFLIWHTWRSAVWSAEMCLYPQEAHAGGLISTPYRYRWAETMRDFHQSSAQHFHRELFPPTPIDWEEFAYRYRKTEGHK